MIVGGPGWSADVQKAVEAFAERFDMPVAPAFRYQDYIDNRHRCHVGCAGIGIDPELAAAIKAADLLIVVGARLGEMTTSQYTLLDIPNPKQFLVHVHPSPDELGSVYRRRSADRGDGAGVCRGAGRAAAARARSPGRGLRAELRAAYERSLKPIAMPGSVKLAEVVRTVSQMLPEDGIVTNGAGNYAAFVHRYFEYKRYRTQLAPTSGSMGYGLPAAIAAKLAHPTRAVVNFQGDGCFLMTGQELATAVQYALPIVTIDRQQRHLRHDPHAPGARLSQSRGRHHARQSRFRRLCPQLRRRRRHRRGDQGFRAGVRAALAVGQAVGHRAQDRSGGHLAAQDAD